MAKLYKVTGPDDYLFRIDKVLYLAKGTDKITERPTIVYHLEGSPTTYQMSFPNKESRDKEYDWIAEEMTRV